MAPEQYLAIGFVGALALTAVFFLVWGMFVFMRDLINDELERKYDGRSHTKGRVRLQAVGACGWFALLVPLLAAILIGLGWAISHLLGLD